MISHEQFDLALTGLRMQKRVRRALKMVLVDGKTWRSAASRCGVAESTILRAMRRIWSAGPVMAPVPAGAVPAAHYAGAVELVPGEIAAIVQTTGAGKGRIIRRITSLST